MKLKRCQICKKETDQLLLIRKKVFYLCGKHTKQVEQYFYETVDPPTTNLFFLQLIPYFHTFN